MDARLLSYLAPARALAVEHANHPGALVYIPDFKQAAKCMLNWTLGGWKRHEEEEMVV